MHVRTYFDRLSTNERKRCVGLLCLPLKGAGVASRRMPYWVFPARFGAIRDRRTNVPR